MITIQVQINASKEKVWDCFTQPKHIVNWNFASDDWHCPKATNTLIQDGDFSYTMASKDGSMSFDFIGKFSKIIDYRQLNYLLGDDRIVEITFEEKDGVCLITEKFEAEKVNSEDLQRSGWQAILENFKKYVEGLSR